MLRRSSPVQRVLVYATFFTLSLMIHMILVMPRKAARGEGVAPVASEARLESDADPRAASLDPRAASLDPRAASLDPRAASGEAR